MGYSSGSTVSRVSLIWAIVTKDLVDGLKNRALLTNITVIVFLVLLYRYLPILGSASDPYRVVLYDAGESSFVRDLDESEAIRLRAAESYDGMIRNVGIEDVRTIGLVLPEDFDQQVNESESIVLAAIIDHWVNDEDMTAMQSTLEGELARITGVSVQVNVERETITHPDGAYAFQIGMGLMLVLGMMGMMFTPHLVVAEKESQTIDVIKVSPVKMTDMLIAKALAGGIYGLIMSVIVFVVYGQFVLHWWAIIGALLAGTIFNVSLGLLLGVRLNETRQIGLWGFILFQPLIVSMILGMFIGIPEGIRTAMRWAPTVAMGNAAAQAITASVDLGPYFLSLLITIAWGAVFFGLTAWVMKRADK
jgi:ABC-2 type transport system permease protein